MIMEALLKEFCLLEFSIHLGQIQEEIKYDKSHVLPCALLSSNLCRSLSTGYLPLTDAQSTVSNVIQCVIHSSLPSVFDVPTLVCCKVTSVDGSVPISL